jgi:hypothetical protein
MLTRYEVLSFLHLSRLDLFENGRERSLLRPGSDGTDGGEGVHRKER